MEIRDADPAADSDAVWNIMAPILSAGDTYALPRDWSRAEALAYWYAPGHSVFVATQDSRVLGTYILRANNKGGGAHIANCGYMTHPEERGRGVASAMCHHSLEYAANHGYRGMQFNFVVSTNHRAVALWRSFSFEVVGRLPGAFQHPTLGFVDALVMFRTLSQPE
jgi:ribosomal protein S18 acetylase RimI-like enzyme